MFEAILFFVLAAVIGVMFLFFGYPFFRILLPIWAFFVGMSFGVSGMESMFGPNVVSGSLGLVMGFFFGLVLALLAYFMYSLAVYLFGITAGYALGSGFVLALGFGEGFLSVVVGAAVAILLAFVFAAVKMPKLFIVIITAAAGAMGVITGLFVLFGRIPAVSDSLSLTSYLVAGSWFWIIVWAVLAVVGIVFQYALIQAAKGMDKDLAKEYNWKKEYR